MIRRGWPLGDDTPERWILVTQPEHARLSWELAVAWGSPEVAPLVCPPDDPEHPLAGVRRELLDAIRHHDDGWPDRLDAPRIDPQHNRPYTFTEMPPADAQRISGDSIDACRVFGPLAGWVVASHFDALQAKRPRRHPEWDGWLRDNDRRRTAWLEEWLAASEHHTGALADRCLAWLQAFDWLTLWLCLRAPAFDGDPSPTKPPAEPLTLGGETRTCWPAITFTPTRAPGPDAVGGVGVSPWPFTARSQRLEAGARTIRAGDPADSKVPEPDDPSGPQETSPIGWVLTPR